MNEDRIEDVMAEPPEGENFGTEIQPVRVKDDDVSTTRRLPLDAGKTAFLQDGGWSTVSMEGGRQQEAGGLTTHRGITHPDEYIEPEALRESVESALGYTYEDVSSAYMTGRPTAETRQLRERIDSRLLALSRSGGNMALLARTMDISEKTIDRALTRAREVEVAPVVERPAVKTPHVSFITGLPGAKPRRRRHVGCPNHMRPMDDRRVSTINLSDAEYAKGLETKPGSAAYWEFRDETKPFARGYVAPAKPGQTFPAEYPDDVSYRQFTRGAS